MRPGTGLWRINGRELDEYFPMHRHREVVERPLGVVSAEGTYDLLIRVRGGGPTGQAGAVQLAVARAPDEPHPHKPQVLHHHSRSVERKKPGQPKARKRFQFSKR
jgi:small subunit ribosomal protein S9